MDTGCTRCARLEERLITLLERIDAVLEEDPEEPEPDDDEPEASVWSVQRRLRSEREQRKALEQERNELLAHNAYLRMLGQRR